MALFQGMRQYKTGQTLHRYTLIYIKNRASHEIMAFVTTWIYLEDAMYSEIGQNIEML